MTFSDFNFGADPVCRQMTCQHVSPLIVKAIACQEKKKADSNRVIDKQMRWRVDLIGIRLHSLSSFRFEC